MISAQFPSVSSLSVCSRLYNVGKTTVYELRWLFTFANWFGLDTFISLLLYHPIMNFAYLCVKSITAINILAFLLYFYSEKIIVSKTSVGLLLTLFDKSMIGNISNDIYDTGWTLNGNCNFTVLTGWQPVNWTFLSILFPFQYNGPSVHS